MDIVFHIGANCTDDDRLLKSMLKNADVFAEFGVKVPGPGKYRRLLRETIQGLAGAAPAPDIREVLLDAILDGDEPQRMFLSNANFICIPNKIFDQGLFYAQTEDKVKGLLRLFPDDHITFCLGLRNPATFVPEAFRQSKADTPEAFLRGFPPALIRWSDVVHRIRFVAPDAPIVVWCNEDTPLIWAELIRELAGIPPRTRITGGFDMLAALMAPEGMSRLARFIREHPPQTVAQKRRIIAAFLDRYALPDALEEEVDFPGLTEDSIAQISAAYDADVALIGQIDGVRLIEA